jgi:hypothetical protein
MEWWREEFETLVLLGKAFEPEKSGASERQREEEEQATSDLCPQTVPLFKRKKAGAG